jgi:hypothetical protein
MPPNSGEYYCAPKFISSFPTDMSELVMFPITSDMLDKRERAQEEIAHAQASISFREENDTPDLTRFVIYSTEGSISVYLNKTKREVLVIGANNTRALRIANIPIEYGHIEDAGLYDGKFTIDTRIGEDEGLIIYCSLNTKEVTCIDHWCRMIAR